MAGNKGRLDQEKVLKVALLILSFIFIGELYANADDIHTKKYDRTIFYQKNDSRLSVQRKDGKPITDEDIEKTISDFEEFASCCPQRSCQSCGALWFCHQRQQYRHTAP